MTVSFFIIRFKQIYRAVVGIGIIRSIILLGIIIVTGIGVEIHSSQEPNVYFITGLTILILLYFHLKRKDKRFLRSRFGTYRLIILIEYLLYVSPIVFSLVYHAQISSLVVLILSVFIIPLIHIRPKYRKLNTIIQRIIPNDSFEWKAGSRKAMFYIIPIWLAGFATFFFVGSIPFVILIVALIPLGFYDKGEPYQMIIATELSSNKFLTLKILRQIQIFSILSIPLIICYLFLHPQYWFIPLIEYGFFISLHIYFILAKYSFYEPNVKSSTAQLYAAFGALSLFIPFLFPIVWIMSVYFYFKSKKKLNYYLNDFNKRT